MSNLTPPVTPRSTRSSSERRTSELGSFAIRGAQGGHHIGGDMARTQLFTELSLVQDFRLALDAKVGPRDYEFLYVHAMALAQFAREAMETASLSAPSPVTH